MESEQPTQNTPPPQVPVSLPDTLRRLEWREELLAIAIVLAEASLVWLAFGLVMAETETRSAYPFAVIAVVMLAAHYVTHLLDKARVWSPDYEIIMSVSIILTLLIALKAASFPQYAIYDLNWIVEAINGLAFFDTDSTRPAWGSVILIAYAWFRGRSREEPSIDSAYTMLRWGTLALGIIVIVVLVGAPDELEVRSLLSIGTVSFFAFALASIGLARMRLEGVRAAAPLGARWLATFATPILVILLVAILAAGIFSRRFLDTVLWALAPVFFVLSVVFQIIVLAIAIIAFLILTPIFWLIGDFEPALTDVTATPPTDQAQGVTEQPPPETWVVPEALQYLIAAIFLVAIISLLTRYIFKRRARKRPVTTEERESVLDWSDLFGSLGDSLRSLFERDGEGDPYAALRGDERWRFTIRVRERYRDLQNRGGELGRARRERETAEEYRPVVGSRFQSEARPIVNDMTATYRRVRYSGEPAEEADADGMDSGWSRLKDAETQGTGD